MCRLLSLTGFPLKRKTEGSTAAKRKEETVPTINIDDVQAHLPQMCQDASRLPSHGNGNSESSRVPFFVAATGTRAFGQ